MMMVVVVGRLEGRAISMVQLELELELERQDRIYRGKCLLALRVATPAT